MMQRIIVVMTHEGWPTFDADSTWSDAQIDEEVEKRYGTQPDQKPHEWAYQDRPLTATVPSKK